MKRKNINIGLFGFGCVGQGLHEVLQKTPGLKASIRKICVKDPAKIRSLPPSSFTFDKNEILDDPSINVVVELIDDAAAAFEIVSAALRQGKAVVSANKKMIAEHFNELLELQKKHNAPLLYEAACCASVPIIRNLEEYYDNDLLESIEGIVNGSTNYILSQTFSENISYSEALKQAQEKGFAESDPRLDVGGFDAKYKLVILIAHAFGIYISPDSIFNYGIENLGTLELNYAREKGKKIKLVAQAFKNSEGNISAFVIPKFVGPESRLYHVDGVFNGVLTKTSFSDVQFFAGKGAGATPTASAVLSDLSALSYDYRYEYKKLAWEEPTGYEKDVLLKIFLRHERENAELWKPLFESVEESFFNSKEGYLIGNIRLENLKRICQEENRENSVVLVELVGPSCRRAFASPPTQSKELEYA